MTEVTPDIFWSLMGLVIGWTTGFGLGYFTGKNRRT